MEKVQIDIEHAEWFFDLVFGLYKHSKDKMTFEEKRSALQHLVKLRTAMTDAGYYEYQKEKLGEDVWDKKVPEIWEQILGISLGKNVLVDFTTAITKQQFMNLVKESEEG